MSSKSLVDTILFSIVCVALIFLIVGCSTTGQQDNSRQKTCEDWKSESWSYRDSPEEQFRIRQQNEERSAFCGGLVLREAPASSVRNFR